MYLHNSKIKVFHLTFSQKQTNTEGEREREGGRGERDLNTRDYKYIIYGISFHNLVSFPVTRKLALK